MSSSSSVRTGQLLVGDRQGGDGADGAVEHPGGALVVVVADLDDLVPGPEHPRPVPPLRVSSRPGREGLLQQRVEGAGAGRAAVHRRQHLDVPRGDAELPGDPLGDQVDHPLAVAVGLVGGEQEEVGVLAEHRGLAGVDPVRVDHHPGLLGLPEDLGEPDPGDGVGGQHVAQHLPGADRGQLVHVTDQQQMRPRRDRLDQFVGQDQVEHAGLVDHDQVGVERMVPVEAGVPARAQLQQPVHGGGRVPGQLGQPFRRPPGRRRQHDLRPLRRRQRDHRFDGERLAAARPAGQHRHPLRQRQPHRLLLLGGQLRPGAAAQPGQRLAPVHRCRRRASDPPGGWTAAAGRRPARSRRGGTAPDTPPGWSASDAGGPVRGSPPRRPARSARQARTRRRHAEDLRGVGEQVRLGQVAVPVVGGLREGVLEAGLHPLRAVVWDPDRLGDRVGGLEPDPPHLAANRYGSFRTTEIEPSP
jgi:hypothetical protein